MKLIRKVTLVKMNDGHTVEEFDLWKHQSERTKLDNEVQEYCRMHGKGSAWVEVGE